MTTGTNVQLAAAERPLSPERRYRILMVAPTSFFADYGCHVRILEETRILQKLGHEVTIITYRNGTDVPGVDIRRTLPIPWRTQYEVGSSRHKIAFDALLGLETLRLLSRQRFDVIHAHLHEGALIGLLLGRLFHTPMVFDFQGSLTEEMIDHHFLARESLLYGPLRRFERWLDRSAPVILTSTAHAEQLLVNHFDCEPERVVSLPDCVDTDAFRPAGEFDPALRAALRQQLGIPSDSKVIVYLGLLAEYQGTGLLLAAMQRILQRQSNVYLLLMGFPGVEHYQHVAKELGIGERVILTGRIPYALAPTYLSLGDVGAAPKLSLTEGSGKLLNYMAMALPAVAFDTPVAREYLGAHGFYAQRGDLASLAEMLLAALDEPARGLALRERAIQHFSWLRAGRQIVEIYRRVKGDQPCPVDAAMQTAIQK
jgi:glycosyltransferase involved in cell wall biosynthesis